MLCFSFSGVQGLSWRDVQFISASSCVACADPSAVAAALFEPTHRIMFCSDVAGTVPLGLCRIIKAQKSVSADKALRYCLRSEAFIAKAFKLDRKLGRVLA